MEPITMATYISHANNPGLTLGAAADEQDICNIQIISACSRW